MAVLGSPERLTVAVLLSVVAEGGVVALMVMLAVAFAAIGEVVEQVTVDVPEQDHPAGAARFTLVRPAGSASDRTLAVAGAAA